MSDHKFLLPEHHAENLNSSLFSGKEAFQIPKFNSNPFSSVHFSLLCLLLKIFLKHLCASFNQNIINTSLFDSYLLLSNAIMKTIDPEISQVHS